MMYFRRFLLVVEGELAGCQHLAPEASFIAQA
jgi:hypothetical protein